jgi:cytochrome c553
MSAAWRRVALIVGSGLLLALGVGFLGLLPTRASSGHWAVTEWFLQFFKTRSVSFYALGVTPPPLDHPGHVVRGAAYFETGCVWCHAAPGRPASFVSEAMMPPPPPLDEVGEAWSPAELFHVTKHGIKFTGMPAWPALGRDDEVWDMVAFLKLLPALDSAAYRRLAWGEERSAAAEPSASSEPASELADQAPAGGPDPPRPALEGCARCHGADGNGRAGAFPRLAGQKRAYLHAALDAFAEGRRHSGVMQPVATALPEGVREALATYYAALEPAEEDGGAREADAFAAGAPDAEAVARGGQLAARGLPAEAIPACVQCHGPGPQERNEHYPRLAGQPRDYLELQLRLFRDDERGGSAYAPIMQEIASRLDDEHIREVAAWYASLAVEGGR